MENMERILDGLRQERTFVAGDEEAERAVDAEIARVEQLLGGDAAPARVEPASDDDTADGDTAEGADEEPSLVCDCGFEARNAGGLAAHQRSHEESGES